MERYNNMKKILEIIEKTSIRDYIIFWLCVITLLNSYEGSQMTYKPVCEINLQGEHEIYALLSTNYDGTTFAHCKSEKVFLIYGKYADNQ